MKKWILFQWVALWAAAYGYAIYSSFVSLPLLPAILLTLCAVDHFVRWLSELRYKFDV